MQPQITGDIPMVENTKSRSFPTKNVIIAGVVLLVIAIAVAVFSQTSPTESSMNNVATESPITGTIIDQNNQANTMENSDQLSDDDMSMRVIQVEAGSFYYAPNEIRVKRGEPVRIEMTSVDMMHNFVIDELNIEIPITQAGETSKVEFTPIEVGEYEFYCGVGNHRAQGQVGTLIVEE